MWKWSLLALGLGLLFAVLAWSGLRRRSSWRDGEKLWGQVAGVSVTPVWNGADSMDGDRSPARVTLRLSLNRNRMKEHKRLNRSQELRFIHSSPQKFTISPKNKRSFSRTSREKSNSVRSLTMLSS